MMTNTLSPADVFSLKQQHPSLFSQQRRYLRLVVGIGVAIVFYYIFFFNFFGIPWSAFVHGSQQIGRYFLRMFVWHDFINWPFKYYFGQIFITLAIVFAGTLTATLIALPLSFLAARNVMDTPVLRVISFVVRRFLDIFRGIDMAIWGLIFVRAVGMGPLAGVLAIFMQDMGLLGKLYAEGHEAVDKSPSRGLTAMGANPLQKHRFGIFTQSFPTFLALSLYQVESNTRSAAVLGFVGAGGIGLVYAENMRLWNWDVVMFITLIMVVIVMVMDKISAMLRNKYIIGEEINLYKLDSRDLCIITNDK
ncbi:putative ABC transport membrane permease [Yersinia nurmii]|uniref:ABC transport membrane permease n=1 Tax=Yersinia nurmii TaxID=685706 RepID=A0ABM9S2D9_9GAMM|nr:phosphonate ABC transporter, permease protein PhnE [Yersinia nurmii]CND96523.1 putative ABC transport membrane permease [Yersinia nurmii]